MELSSSSRGSVVNALSHDQLTEIVHFMKTKTYKRAGESIPYLEQTDRGWRCTLACTVDAKGKPKYPQLDLSRFSFGTALGKQLVHLIYWRYDNDGEQISADLNISHCDADHTILNLVQETRDYNESRKYCHLFGWYKAKSGEDRPRCPHWEYPCCGP